MIPLLKFQYVFASAVNLGQLHKCVCGLDADVCHHALSCFKSTRRFSKHFYISDIIQRALTCIAIPSILELLVSVVMMAHSLVDLPQYYGLSQIFVVECYVHRYFGSFTFIAYLPPSVFGCIISRHN